MQSQTDLFVCRVEDLHQSVHKGGVLLPLLLAQHLHLAQFAEVEVSLLLHPFQRQLQCTHLGGVTVKIKAMFEINHTPF